MNLLPIANHLVAAGYGVLGKDLFLEHMDASVRVGVMLRSWPDGDPVNHELPGYRKTKFQLIVRGAKREEVRLRALALSKALSMGRVTLTDGVDTYHLQVSRPEQEPMVYPKSEGNSIEGSVTIYLSYAQG